MPHGGRAWARAGPTVRSGASSRSRRCSIGRASPPTRGQDVNAL
jgi:hypothetical protein